MPPGSIRSPDGQMLPQAATGGRPDTSPAARLARIEANRKTRPGRPGRKASNAIPKHASTPIPTPTPSSPSPSFPSLASDASPSLWLSLGRKLRVGRWLSRQPVLAEEGDEKISTTSSLDAQVASEPDLDSVHDDATPEVARNTRSPDAEFVAVVSDSPEELLLYVGSAGSPIDQLSPGDDVYNGNLLFDAAPFHSSLADPVKDASPPSPESDAPRPWHVFDHYDDAPESLPSLIPDDCSSPMDTATVDHIRASEAEEEGMVESRSAGVPRLDAQNEAALEQATSRQPDGDAGHLVSYPTDHSKHMYALKKESLVGSLVDAFYAWQASGQTSGPQYQQATQGEPSGARSSDNGNADNAKKASNNSNKNNRKRKGTPKTYKDDEASDDGNSSAGVPAAKRRKPRNPKEKTFACPYFKKDPLSHFSCLDRRLSKASYVRQHLLRAHKKALYYCPRCHEQLSDQQAFDAHIRAPTPCEILAGTREWMSDDQYTQIRNESTTRGMSDEARWYIMWRILFPGVEPPPNPYIRHGVYEGFNAMRNFMLSHPGIVSRTLQFSGFGPASNFGPELERSFIERLLDDAEGVAAEELRTLPAEPSSSIDTSASILGTQTQATMETAPTSISETAPSAAEATAKPSRKNTGRKNSKKVNKWVQEADIAEITAPGDGASAFNYHEARHNAQPRPNEGPTPVLSRLNSLATPRSSGLPDRDASRLSVEVPHQMIGSPSDASAIGSPNLFPGGGFSNMLSERSYAAASNTYLESAPAPEYPHPYVPPPPQTYPPSFYTPTPPSLPHVPPEQIQLGADNQEFETMRSGFPSYWRIRPGLPVRQAPASLQSDMGWDTRGLPSEGFQQPHSAASNFSLTTVPGRSLRNTGAIQGFHQRGQIVDRSQASTGAYGHFDPQSNFEYTDPGFSDYEMGEQHMEPVSNPAEDGSAPHPLVAAPDPWSFEYCIDMNTTDAEDNGGEIKGEGS